MAQLSRLQAGSVRRTVSLKGPHTGERVILVQLGEASCKNTQGPVEEGVYQARDAKARRSDELI